MDNFVIKNQNKLRCGITTGTCAAAAAEAGAALLLMNIEKNEINIHTPKGTEVKVPVNKISNSQDRAEFMVVKDSGDDPDVTNRAEIYVSIEKTENISSNAFIYKGYNNLFLDGGKGIGRVTKEGLEQSIGQAAINKVPRSMIFNAVDNICRLAEYREKLLITVTVPNGEELSKHTFNSRLGIEGGISILGTSGILEPMSERAIIDTIETEMRQLSVQGVENIIITPGNYGRSYASKYLNMDLDKSIKCSNYIGETLDFACAYGFKNILIIGNIGKLVKLGAGTMNTHSSVADGRQEIMALHTVLQGGSTETARKIMQCINTEEMLAILDKEELRQTVIDSICKKIHEHIKRRTGDKLNFGVMLFSEKYGFLGKTENTDIVLNKFL